MARKKAAPAAAEEPEPPRRARRTVDLDPELARRIGVIASLLDISIPDYVNNRLRPIVDAELPEALRQMGLPRSQE